MTASSMTRSARLARRLLELVLPKPHRAVVLTHLDEEYAHVMRTQSPRSAARWYRRQVTGSLPGAMQMRMQSTHSGNGRSASVLRRVSRIFGEFLHDARYGLRQLRKAPGFSIAAVLMLAIGLGLVSGAYTVVNGLFVRGWNVPDSASVFRAIGTAGGAPEGGRIRDGFSLGAFQQIRTNSRSAEYVAYLIEYSRLTAKAGTPGLYSAGLFVSDNFLDVLQIPLQSGQGFAGTTTADVRVILTDRTWARVFNREPGIVGRSVWMSTIPATVVGVTAPGFDGLAERTVEFMVEISGGVQWKGRYVGEVAADDRNCCISLVGRRRPGWSSTQVREELALLSAHYRQSLARPPLNVALRSTAPGLQNERGAGVILSLVFAGVMLVWCLTCANVGNLFLAKSLRRSREIAVRMALGASRARVVRQLLAEGLVLASISGAAAYLATAGIPVLMGQLDGGASSMFAPDLMVAAFAALGTMLTSVLVALAPALHATRIAWKGAGRTATIRGGRFREIALAVQIAVAAVLMLSATLVGRGILQAASGGADFALNTTTAVSFTLPADTANDMKQSEAARRGLRSAVMKSAPGLGLADQSPVSERSGIQSSVKPAGSEADFAITLLPLSAAAFDVLDVPLIEGRHVDDAVSNEAVINATMARRIWPGESAIGKTVSLNFNRRGYTVVGVTRDAHLTGLSAIEPMMHFTPYLSVGIVLARPAPDLERRMIDLARTVDPTLTVELIPLSDSVQDTLNAARVGATTAGGLGVVALLLAIVGVFGVFSYLIEELRREIGIRLALGATKRQIRLALAQACRRPVLAGLAAGVVMSLVSGALLRGFLFGLSPLDPVSYAVVALILTLSAIAATAVPVRRALRVDPSITLRAD